MDLNKIPVLKMITTQMDWLNQRQKVLSQNIANADTPDYVAHDLARTAIAGGLMPHCVIHHAMTAPHHGTLSAL